MAFPVAIPVTAGATAGVSWVVAQYSDWVARYFALQRVRAKPYNYKGVIYRAIYSENRDEPLVPRCQLVRLDRRLVRLKILADGPLCGTHLDMTVLEFEKLYPFVEPPQAPAWTGPQHRFPPARH